MTHRSTFPASDQCWYLWLQVGLALCVAVPLSGCNSGSSACTRICTWIANCYSSAGLTAPSCPFSASCSAHDQCQIDCYDQSSCDAVTKKNIDAYSQLQACINQCSKVPDLGPGPDFSKLPEGTGPLLDATEPQPEGIVPPEDGPLPDLQPKPDWTVVLDKAVKDSTMAPDASAVDQAKPDATMPTCDPSCQAKHPTYCTKNSSGNCVECTTDAHCQINVGAFGPKCDTTKTYCVCASNAECKGNHWGSHCDTTKELCNCTSNSHCNTSTFGNTCSSTGHCECSTASDCSGNTFGSKCDSTKTSFCYCSSSTDCPTGKSCTGFFGSGLWTYCE